MPIRFAPGPKNGSTLVQQHVGQLIQRPQGAPKALQSQSATGAQLRPPHAVYDLHADEVSEGYGLERAHLTAHRYLLGPSSGAVAAAEVVSDASGNASLVANVNFGPFVDATDRALTAIAKLPQVATKTFEVRLLRFAAVHVIALWLVPDGGGDQIVYPLAPTPAVLQPDTPYSAADFIAAVAPLARKRKARSADSIP